MDNKHIEGIYLNLKTNIKNQYSGYGSIITMYDPTSMLIDLAGVNDYFKTTGCHKYINEYFINKKVSHNFHTADVDIVVSNVFDIRSDSGFNTVLQKRFFKIYVDEYLEKNDYYYSYYIVTSDLPKNINKIRVHFTNNKHDDIPYEHITKITKYQGLLSMKPNIIYTFGNINLFFKDKDQILDFYNSILDIIPMICGDNQEVEIDSDIYKEILNKIDWDNYVYSYYEVHDAKELDIDKDKLDQLLRSFLNEFIEIKKKEYLDKLADDHQTLGSKLLRWRDVILLKNIKKEEVIKYKNKDLLELYEYVNSNDNYYISGMEFSKIKSEIINRYGIKVYMYDINKLSNIKYGNYDYNLLTYRVILKSHYYPIEISKILDQINDTNEFNASMAMQTCNNVSIKTNLIPEDLEYHWMYDEISWRLSIPKRFLDMELCLLYKNIEDLLNVLDNAISQSTLFVIREDLMNNPDAFQRYKKYIKCLVDTYKTSQEIGLYDIPSIIYYKDNKAREISIDNLLSIIDKMKEGFKFKIGSIKLTDKYISILKEKYFRECVHKDFKDIIDTICREKK